MLSLTTQAKDKLQVIRKTWRQSDALIIDAIGAEKAQLLGELTLELTQALGGNVPGLPAALEQNRARK